jgi:Tol biopolymer transport system component
MRKILLFILLLPFTIFSQFNEFHPEYEWLTIKGKNIFVHYHPEAERTAKIVAKIADEVWDPICSLYEYQPDPVHYVIKDIDDYSNGATYFFDNKIEIWASALDFDLRGSHNWLRNVISHEFTHMVQIQASMKLSRSIPAIYLQMLNYEDKRRPDILYGFPNFIASYPIATINMPAWFAEGTAQYMRKEFDYDNWDSHRDMILRSYALENKLLTWNQMGVFNKTSLGNESVYNSGYALTLYIAQKYGEDKLREITKKLGKITNFTIDAAFKDVLGIDGDKVYDEWSTFLKSDYKQRIKDVEENLVQGKMVAEKGFGNFYPTFSSDGRYIAYVSNKGADYFGLSSIYLYDTQTKEEKQIKSLIRSSISFIPNTNKIVYAKIGHENPGMVNIHDLYVYDIDTKKEDRLTFGLRANNPSVSSDGKNIVFLYQKDGTSNIGIVDIDGKNLKQLTFYSAGEQVYNPKFSPKNDFIVYGFSIANSREIMKVNISDSQISFLVKNGFDNRDPFFDINGNLIYSSDETGIFNIYSMDVNTKEKRRISNVLGGVFQPQSNANGSIVYSGYTVDGFKLFLLDSEETKKVDDSKRYIPSQNYPLGEDKFKGDMAKYDINYLRNYNDSTLPEYSSTKYTGFFSRLSLIPFVRYDNYNTSNSGFDKIKPGVYVLSSDFLNRYSLFAGGSINKRFERDLFFNFEYRERVPLLYNLGLRPEMSVELYSISRKANTPLEFDPLDPSQNTATDVTYDLFEFDIIGKHKIVSEDTYLEARYIYSSYTATLGSFIFPNTTILYPTTKDTYLIGSNLQLKLSHEEIIPTIDSDINPVGRKVELQYNYEMNRYNNEGTYEYQDGYLLPVYSKFNYHKLEFNWKEYIEVFKDQTLTAQFRAASILGPTVPDFFDFYLGGLIGMKSYPFYSVSGNELGWLNLTYRFPLIKNIDTRLGHLYIDKVYLSVYGDFGNAWNGKIPSLNNFKKGAGAEIRIKMNSFYLFPTSLFFNAAYSFDKISRVISNETVNYGKEWSFYGGILFDFNF